MYMRRILISLSVFFLMTVSMSSQAEKLDKIAAIVNDEVITENELQGEIELLRERLSQKKVALPSPEILRQQVLDHSIDVDLQIQIAKRNNIKIDATAIDDALKGIAERNNLTLDSLKNSMISQGLTWKKYRENIKKEMLLSRVQQGAVGQIIVSDTEVDDFLKANKQKENHLFHIKDLVISLPEAPSPEVIKKANDKAHDLMLALRKGLDFSEAAVSKSGGEFVFEGGDLGFRQLAGLPEMFASRVVKMKAGDIEGPIRAPNGFHIIKLVEVKGDTAKQMVMLTRARHILLKVDPGASSEQVEQRLKTIALQIKRGQSFASMAKQFSVDTHSAKDGGELGWVHRGELVTEVEKVMDKLKPGQMSDPIKSDNGWHLIKVEARKNIDDSKAYQREQVKQELYQRRFYEAVQNWLQQLKANSYVKIF